MNAIDRFLLDTASLFSKITSGWNLYEGCKEAANDVIGHPALAYSLRHPDRIFMPMPMRHITNMPWLPATPDRDGKRMRGKWQCVIIFYYSFIELYMTYIELELHT